MTCNNVGAPLGMGLWEGVPLRDVIWATKPTANIRRVFYYGHHNNDPSKYSVVHCRSAGCLRIHQETTQ